MTNYCLWKANCTLINPRKFARDSLNNYLCCHSCKDTKCEYRCTDCLETCKSTSDEDYVQQILDRTNKPFITLPEKTGVKKVGDNLPTNVENVMHSQSATVEQPKSNNATVIRVPQNKQALARLLGVSYDKVAYRIEVKHKTYEQVYEELKR